MCASLGVLQGFFELVGFAAGRVLWRGGVSARGFDVLERGL